VISGPECLPWSKRELVATSRVQNEGKQLNLATEKFVVEADSESIPFDALRASEPRP